MKKPMVKNAVIPNIVIAGVTKAGTTSLFTYLSDHPDVCGSTVKEISHFLTVRFREPSLPIDNYSQYFGHYGDERYRLEASPAYFLGRGELAETMKAALHDVKVILVLREPVSRCLSHFKFNKNMLTLPREMKLDEYFKKCQEMPYESFRERWSYIYYGLASGIYSNYIEEWIEIFGDDLHICFFDDLIQDAPGFTKRISRWLELDETFYDDYDFVIENMGRDFNNAALQSIALKLNKNFESFFRRHIGIKRALRNFYFSINGSKRRVGGNDNNSETVARMKEYYAPHNKTLREQLLKANVTNLPVWLREAE